MTFGVRHDQTDVLASGWHKLLLGAALCLPVPVFAASGLAVPLPAAVYRVAAGIVGQTHAITQAFAPFGGAAEAPQLLSAPSEEPESLFTAARTRPATPARTAPTGRGTGAAGAVPTTTRRALSARKHRPEASRSGERTGVLYTFASEPAQAANEAAQTLAFSADPSPSGEPKEHRFTTRPESQPPARTEHPARTEQPTKDETPTTRSDDPERNDSAPRDDSSPRERRTSPPAAIAPPPPLPSAERTDLPPAEAPEAKSARAMLRALVGDNPGTPLASKIEDALDKLDEADIELAKTPPDLSAALNNIEDAVGDVEAAVEQGLLAAARGKTIMLLLAEEARSLAQTTIDEAIERSGEVSKIVEAEQRLSEGDGHLAADEFKRAVARYKDALAKAEGA
jgi:hypothetical protein